jgi:hypothetical protein
MKVDIKARILKRRTSSFAEVKALADEIFKNGGGVCRAKG